MKTTIEHKTVVLEIDYNYQPQEPQTEFYPGCDEEITYNTINYKGVNVWEIYHHNDILKEISDLILEQREDDKIEADIEKHIAKYEADLDDRFKRIIFPLNYR